MASFPYHLTQSTSSVVGLKNYHERLRLFSDGPLFSAQLIFNVYLSLPEEWSLKQGFDNCSPEYATSDRNVVHVKPDEP